MSNFPNFWKTYITPQYLEKISKIVKKKKEKKFDIVQARPQLNNCLVRVGFMVNKKKKKKKPSQQERDAFLFEEVIPFSRGYYMLDMASIEIM